MPNHRFGRDPAHAGTTKRAAIVYHNAGTSNIVHRRLGAYHTRRSMLVVHVVLVQDRVPVIDPHTVHVLVQAIVGRLQRGA